MILINIFLATHAITCQSSVRRTSERNLSTTNGSGNWSAIRVPIGIKRIVQNLPGLLRAQRREGRLTVLGISPSRPSNDPQGRAPSGCLGAFQYRKNHLRQPVV